MKPLLLQQLGPQGMERGGSGHGGEGRGDPATRGVQRKRAHVEGVPMATRTLVLVITVPVCRYLKSNQHKSCLNIIQQNKAEHSTWYKNTYMTMTR